MKIRLFFITVGVFIAVLALTIPAAAQVPDTINFQGMLTDDSGDAVPDGSYVMQFYLFDAAAGGSQLWNSPDGEQQTVAVTNGVYNIQLGINQPLGSTIFDGGAVWLEVVVEGETLSPRQYITAAPFALKAGDADTLTGNSLTDLDGRYVQQGETGAVDSNMITDGSVTSDDLGADSVNAGEIAAGAVRSSEVANNSLTADDLGIDSVTASEIATGAVGSSEIADGSVTAADLADGAALAEILDDDGPGSGLNADRLDGLSSGSFMSAGTDNWVNVTGDTMTGPLELTTNLILPATTTTTGIIRSGTDTLIHTYGLRNFYAGVNAGNFTMTGDNNTAIGELALKANTTGDYNTATGYVALDANTTGSYNTACGAAVLSANTTGRDNSAAGAFALNFNTTGSENTAMGASALYRNEAGSYNTAIGYYALRYSLSGEYNTATGWAALSGFLSTGDYNTANGAAALTNNSTGFDNTAVGYRAGRTNTEGHSNTFIGKEAGYSNTTAYSNTFVGEGSGYSNIIGNYNTLIGNGAGYSNTGSANTYLGVNAGHANIDGDGNTYIGQLAGLNGTTGDFNTFLGRESGIDATGDYNTFLGRRAGYNNETGNRNIFIGNLAGYNETGSDKLYLDNSSTATPLIWGDFSTNVAAVNGRLGVGVQPGSAYQFHSLEETAGGRAVYGQTTANSAIGVWGHATGDNSTGVWGTGVLYDFYASGPGTNYAASSSIRWKENIQEIEGALDMVLQMRGVYFDWDAEHGGEHDMGFIAEEVGAYVPEVVGFEPDSEYASGMDYGKMTPVLLQAIKEQQAIIDRQEGAITALQSAVAQLQVQIAAIRAER